MRPHELQTEEKAEPVCCGISCCIPRGKDVRGEQTSMRNMMASCATCCRWFPLVPIVMGTIFLLLAYYLAPEVIRVLWIAVGATIVTMGLLGLVVVGRMAKRLSSADCR